MKNRYQQVFDQIDTPQTLEEKLENIPSQKASKRVIRPSKALVAAVIVAVVFFSGILTANATVEGGIAGIIAGMPFFNDSEEYKEEFSSYDVENIAKSGPYSDADKYKDDFSDYDLEATSDSSETDNTGYDVEAASDSSEADNTGWVKKDGEWYYYINGYPADGFYLIDGYWYYFGYEGAGKMAYDVSIPPGTFDSEGHWVYEGKKNSDYDVTPAPVAQNVTFEEFAARHPVSIIIRHYERMDAQTYHSNEVDGKEHQYYVFGRDYGDDYSNIAIEDLYEYHSVSTDDKKIVDEITEQTLKMNELPTNDFRRVPANDDYRIVFVFEDGSSDYLAVKKDTEGNYYYQTRYNCCYQADINEIEALYNSLQ